MLVMTHELIHHLGPEVNSHDVVLHVTVINILPD